jgi:hypothetical protein
MVWDAEKLKASKHKYNQSEKGKEKNRLQRQKYVANKDNRHKLRMLAWKKRGLKYYPEDLCQIYEEVQCCSFCSIQLTKNFMEHNHTTGSFRGFTCSSCNTTLGRTDSLFRMMMKELKLIFNLPKVLKIKY